LLHQLDRAGVLLILLVPLLGKISEVLHDLLHKVRNHLLSAMEVLVVLEPAVFGQQERPDPKLYPTMIVTVGLLFVVAQLNLDVFRDEGLNQSLDAIWVVVPPASVHVGPVLEDDCPILRLVTAGGIQH